jgi:purine-binding chemotaxis protein CheW
VDEENTIESLDDLSGRYLTFYLEDVIYSLPLNHVIEIISMQRITHIPGAPNYIKGIVNLRGKVVPIADARLKLGQPERSYDEETCIVIVFINEMNIGLIVDKVAEVVTLEKIEKAPSTMAEKREGESYLDSISTISDKVVLNIDCAKFFQSDMARVFAQEG